MGEPGGRPKKEAAAGFGRGLCTRPMNMDLMLGVVGNQWRWAGTWFGWYWESWQQNYRGLCKWRKECGNRTRCPGRGQHLLLPRLQQLWVAKKHSVIAGIVLLKGGFGNTPEWAAAVLLPDGQTSRRAKPENNANSWHSSAKLSLCPAKLSIYINSLYLSTAFSSSLFAHEETEAQRG